MAIFELLDYIVNEVSSLVLSVFFVFSFSGFHHVEHMLGKYCRQRTKFWLGSGPWGRSLSKLNKPV